MQKILFIGLAIMMLGACTNQASDLKSPCVGAEGSPCDRRAVNSEYQG